MKFIVLNKSTGGIMKKILITICSFLIIISASFPVLAAEKFSEDFSDPSKLTYFVFENDGFIVQDGAFVAKSVNKYNAAYYGEYFETCVYEFDFKDYGDGDHVGGASLRVGSARYDVEVRSDAKNDDEKIVIWKGGPNKKASNTMKATGKGIPSIPVGSWTNIKIAMTRDTIKVYANDILYLDYKDSLPYTSGGFGIRSANSKIGYDNIKIYDIADLKLNPKPTAGATSSKSSSIKSSSTISSGTAQSSIVTSSEIAASSEVISESISEISEGTSSSDSASVITSEETSMSSSSSSSDVETEKGLPPLILMIIILAVIVAAGAVFFILRKIRSNKT